MHRLQGFATIWSLLALSFLSGCGSQQPLTPQQQAHELFGDGQFDDAIVTIDQLLANPDQLDIDQHTDMLTLKGRCYWEQSDAAYRQKQFDQQMALLGQAHQFLSESIAVKDTAEARHIRSLVLEQMGREDEALDDQLAWRRLDVEFGKAYLNERPDPSYSELLTDRSETETEEQPTNDSSPRTVTRQAPSGQSDESSEESGDTASTTWQPTSRRSATDAETEDAEANSSDARQRLRRLRTADDVAQTDEEASAEDDESNDDQETTAEDAPPLTPPIQRAPGTQFVTPFPSPQTDFNIANGDDYLRPAPTGATGRSLYPGLRSQPTTGITFQGGPESPTPFSVPATGIGAATPQTSTGSVAATTGGATGIGGTDLSVDTAAPSFGFPAPNAGRPTTNPADKEDSGTRQLPSGIMIEFHPTLRNQQPFGTYIGQGLSFTGALPQDARPNNTTFQPGQQNAPLPPNQVDFSRGPYYNPLHPNPTLDPNLLRVDPTR